MIKALIFDCFGVLYLDAHESFSQKFPHIANELHEINQKADRGTVSRDEYITAVADLTREDPIAIEESVHGEHRINAELIKLIHSQYKPQYKIGILTNLGRGWLNDFFDKNQLHELFDVVVVSGDERLTKPNPAIFKLAADRLEVAPADCVMIDDIAENCLGAAKAGMQTIHYASNQQFVKDLELLLRR